MLLDSCSFLDPRWWWWGGQRWLAESHCSIWSLSVDFFFSFEIQPLIVSFYSIFFSFLSNIYTYTPLTHFIRRVKVPSLSLSLSLSLFRLFIVPLTTSLSHFPSIFPDVQSFSNNFSSVLNIQGKKGETNFSSFFFFKVLAIELNHVIQFLASFSQMRRNRRWRLRGQVWHYF